MAFTVEEFRDIVQIIEQHPEWRAELRRLVLTDELLSLPRLVRELAEAQRRTDESLKSLAEAQRRTDESLKSLAEAQKRTEERMGLLEERMGLLGERMAALAEAQSRAERQLAELATTMRETREQLTGMGKDVAGLKGLVLQLTYRDRAFAYFAPIARRLHVLTGVEIHDMLQSAVERASLSQEEADELLVADVIARGRSQKMAAEVFLVVEVSWGIGPHDVERAARRAGLLARTGVIAVPVVAGKGIDAEAMELARYRQVRWVLDGQTSK